SAIAESDLPHGKVARTVSLLDPQSPLPPGSHPAALMLSPDEKLLYVALANRDRVAIVETASGRVLRFLNTHLSGQQYAGAIPLALAQTADGKRLFVANAGADALAGLSTAASGESPLG